MRPTRPRQSQTVCEGLFWLSTCANCHTPIQWFGDEWVHGEMDTPVDDMTRYCPAPQPEEGTPVWSS